MATSGTYESCWERRFLEEWLMPSRQKSRCSTEEMRGMDGRSTGGIRSSTTIVDHMVSWFHITSCSGRWNYGDDPGPPHVTCRVDRRQRVSPDARTDGGGASDQCTVYALGHTAACRGVSTGLVRSGEAKNCPVVKFRVSERINNGRAFGVAPLHRAATL